MKDIDDYLHLISKRGRRDGSGGGLLSLLDWCGKTGLREVTEDEARRFWQDPSQPYEEPFTKTEPQQGERD